MMNFIQQSFQVKFDYKVYFTSSLFGQSNDCLRSFLREKKIREIRQKILFVVDNGVLKCHERLLDQIRSYFEEGSVVSLIPEFVIVPGGEVVKNDPRYLKDIVEAVDNHQVDRHSYIAAIGGGAVLDLTGFAAAVSHRGVRHIRIPTTVLSQNDSGVGVKNGINYQNKKNFLGTFVPPVAVFNDAHFLSTLDERSWRSGMAEAVKVALIKDAHFFFWLEENVDQLTQRDEKTMNSLIHRCAELHLAHIASGDPFEMGSSRPLDFGHWSAHKLEQMTDFKVLHGEAVAMGIVLDTFYSSIIGLLDEKDAQRVAHLLLKLGFEITHPLLQFDDGEREILKGLDEFREHLGGQLTIMLLEDLGKGKEVHEIDIPSLKQASIALRNLSHQ